MKSRWSDREARGLDGLDILVYTSRLIGTHEDLVLWGGGNSSVKVKGNDHTGRPVRILWMKGSGSDMKTATHRAFTPLRLDDLLLLISRRSMSDEEMVAYQLKCVLEPGSPKPSIETLLHAFLPPTHIYHTHADAICALTDTPNWGRVIREVYGQDVSVAPYYRPGFLLSKVTAAVYEKNPGVLGIVLEKHGLITWGESAKEAYHRTIDLVTRAERYIAKKQKSRRRPDGRRARSFPASERRGLAAAILPRLRGLLSRNRRVVLLYDDDAEVLRFVGLPAARTLTQIGPFTPDHLLHTKPWPLFLDGRVLRDPEKAIEEELPRAVESYRARYEAYFERYRSPGVVMLDPYPRVVLIPGLGMITTGKDPRAARIVRDLYRHTMRVILAASAIERYRTLSPEALCDFEYWPLENYKLTLLPPEQELSRRVALITGAAGGIGRAIAARLAEAGACVVLADLDRAGAGKIAAGINQQLGQSVAVSVFMDVTREASVRRAIREAMLAFGGLDILVSNAGIARTAPVERMSLSDWEDSLSVNATGHFLICRESMRIFRQQGIGGNIVVVATKNVLAPGKDFGAYSASKAAQAQLSRILAIEGGEHRVRVNMVSPDGVFQDSGLWSLAVRRERALAHGVPVRELEAFYANRNLLKTRVAPEDVAEAVLFLASDRSAKTTGAILPVDGGLRDAFPR